MAKKPRNKRKRKQNMQQLVAQPVEEAMAEREKELANSGV